MSRNNYNLRVIVAQILEQVINQKKSLTSVLPIYQAKLSDLDRPLLQEICFGVLRTLPLLEWYLSQLMKRTFSGKLTTLHYLLISALYQLIYTRIPDHAVVSETVNAVTVLKNQKMKGVVNGVLRQFLRQKTDLTTQAESQPSYSLHPEWLLLRIKQAYPNEWQQIILANNQRPPMWLRVNCLYHQRDDYLNLLAEQNIEAAIDENSPNAVRLLSPCPVNQLPGFSQGWVSVQDVNAQASMLYLQPQNHERILDLCAAPGGKTTHILEMAPQAEVVAVDIDEQRLKQLRDNLSRLNMKAQVIAGDGCRPEKWSPYQQYDKILLDAPCSATGIIRRHPDIKWLRRDSDIEELAKLQHRILSAIWPYLKTGGILVYITCSILPEENTNQLKRFLGEHTDAQLVNTKGTHEIGHQYLPETDGGDGFFFAQLLKR